MSLRRGGAQAQAQTLPTPGFSHRTVTWDRHFQRKSSGTGSGTTNLVIPADDGCVSRGSEDRRLVRGIRELGDRIGQV